MRAIFNKILVSFLTVFSADALQIEKGFDSVISADFANSTVKTRVEAGSCLMIPNGSSYWVLSPRISAHLNGNFDLNLGVGVRKPFLSTDYTFGYHLFCDFSVQNPHVLSQGGVCLEVLSPFFDVRANYYHPINDLNPFFLGESQKWVEVEGTWKFPKFSVGIVPSYNLTSGHFSIKPKIAIPIPFCTLEAGAIISQNFNEIGSHIGIAVPLYNVGCKPVSRNSSVKHRRCIPLPEKKNSFINLGK